MESDISRRLHDLNTVYLDFKIAVNLIKTGYRFDDEGAPLLIQQLEKALGILKNEVSEMEKESIENYRKVSPKN